MKSRAVGLQCECGEYAGMSAKRTIILSMIISGALAGIGGGSRRSSIYSNVYVQTSSMSVGFNGMAVALLAMNSPIGIPLLPSCLVHFKLGSWYRSQLPS